MSKQSPSEPCHAPFPAHFIQVADSFLEGSQQGQDAARDLMASFFGIAPAGPALAAPTPTAGSEALALAR